MSVELAQRAARVLGAARDRNLTLVTAESCTGGALSVLLAEAPGASDTFHGGFVVYTKENKTAALGIPENLLKEHTAVSDVVNGRSCVVEERVTMEPENGPAPREFHFRVFSST